MSDYGNMKNYEKAYNDYKKGMKYKEIATKYNVADSTVKTWKRRYKWESRGDAKSIHGFESNSEQIKEDLLEQLKNNDISGEHYIDLIDTYLELFNIKNRLINDIRNRGVVVEWSNGTQFGVKKNDSIGELNKIITQMLKLIEALGLKPRQDIGSSDIDEDL